MLTRIGEWFDRAAHRVVPDPFVLALALNLLLLVVGGLTLATGTTALPAGPDGVVPPIPQGLLRAWFTGFGNPAGLAFALQMALVLVTGQALALSRPMTRVLHSVAGLPRTTAQAAALVAFVTCIASLLHWGLGAIAGAIVARAVHEHALQHGRTFHYPLLGAAGYTGFAVFHGGLSGSAPLKVAEANHFLVDTIGVLPISQTLGSPLNLAIIGTLVVVFPAMFYAMAPATPPSHDPLAAQGGGPPEELTANATPAPAADAAGSTDDGAPGLAGWVGAIVAGWIPLAVVAGSLLTGFLHFDINAFTLLFLFAGIGLHANLQRYIDTVTDAARAAGPILLQYPLYFSIVAVMQASGLIVVFSEFFVQWATPRTFPVIAFWSSALLNLVIPSGGGQWAVQGPILCQAGLELGVDPATIVIAFAHGDASTNLLQPFWALPLLGLMGLRAHQIIGYSALACMAMLVVVSVLLGVMG